MAGDINSLNLLVSLVIDAPSPTKFAPANSRISLMNLSCYFIYIITPFIQTLPIKLIFMPPKELWEAYSNCTVRPSVRPCVRPAFVSGPYLLYSLR